MSTASEIKTFVSNHYGLPRHNFTILEKSETNGANAHPLYALGKAKFAGDTKWNFSDKFIFDGSGEVVARTKGTKDTLEAFQAVLSKSRL